MVAEKYWILKSVCLEIPARARGRSTFFCQGLFVRKKKDTQTTDGRIVAVSFILGPPGLQTHVFSQPSSGNCNLFVLMLFPLGPAFIMSHSLTLNFSCLSSPMLYMIITIIIFSCWAFLVSWLGLWDVDCF